MSVPAGENAPRRRAWLGTLIWIAVPLAALIIMLCVSQTAREVTTQTAFTLVQFLSTPFILETTVAVFGLCIVFAWNQWRHEKHERDEWVYLEKTQAPTAEESDGGTPPHRLDAVMWKERPEAFDGTAAALSVIEGFLALDLVADAESAFEEALQDESAHPAGMLNAAEAIATWHNEHNAPQQAVIWKDRAQALEKRRQ
jgi:hypothetical protein